ncbi:aromatic acid exporter family protein [Streptomyces sp. NPDC058287]|uniref:FUSC family protein n=1 Tax=unclassified Streptomyces TaxID=2593676 RepID=UPI0036E2C0E7
MRWSILAWEVSAARRSVRSALAGPGPERDTAVQSLKAAGAALLAWALAGWWWNAPMALLAPWTAMFIVQSTVYRSIRSALQQFCVVLLGTMLAAGAAAATGNSTAAMVIVLPLTVLLGNYARFGTQGMYAPTAALFVLASGASSGDDILHRLLETLLGAVIGIAVNALVLPPVHANTVRHLRERLPQQSAELLHGAADGVRRSYTRDDAAAWYDGAGRLSDLATDLRTARRWANESYRLNPGGKLRRSVGAEPPADHDLTWERVAEHTRMTMRALAEMAPDAPEQAAIPASTSAAVAEILDGAGDLCALDEGTGRRPGRDTTASERARQRRDALTSARDAHRRLARLLTDGSRTPVAALGGITADTGRLLDDLAAVIAPADG